MTIPTRKIRLSGLGALLSLLFYAWPSYGQDSAPSANQPGAMQMDAMQTGAAQPGAMQMDAMQTGAAQPGAMQMDAMQTGAAQSGVMPMSAKKTDAAQAAAIKAEMPFLTENDSAMNRMMNDMAVPPSGDVDHDFVAMMVPHHQGAIEMAQAVLRYGHNQQLRRLAQEIIVTQQQEIAAMRLALGQPLPPDVASPNQILPQAAVNAAATK